MASITIEASKVARKSPIRVDSSLVGTVSGVEDVSVSLPSSKARLSVGKLGYKSNTITVEDGQTVRVTSNFLNRFHSDSAIVTLSCWRPLPPTCGSPIYYNFAF